MSETFVLVHGAFRTGWSWHLVAERLSTIGYHVAVPELRGMGGPVVPEGHAVSLADWVDDVIDTVPSEATVVLVGHSMGGVVAQVAAARLGARLARLVLLDAPLVRRGQRALDVSSSEPLDESSLPPPTAMVPARPVGIGEGFHDPTLAAELNRRLVPTPIGPSLDRCPVDPPDAQVWFCRHTPPGYPSALARRRCDELGQPYRLLDCHHDAPLLCPDAVVAALVSP